MVGGGRGRVKAALALALLASAAGGCFWRSYGRIAETHAEVLTAIARKGVDLVANDRFTAESMPELTYPLERAQAFASAAAEHSGTERPASLAALEELLARYRAFVDVLDRVRRARTGDEARTALAAPLAAVEAAAEDLRAALRAEHRL